MDRIRLKDMDDPAFGECWQLYWDAFPVYEQRRKEEQRGAMMQPDYHFDAIYQAGRFVGIMLYWKQKDFIYLEHFAIAPGLRGGGFGTKALSMLLDEGTQVILEIDPVKDEISEKRLHFYQSLGFCRNEFKHIHPPYRHQFTGHALEVLSSGGELDTAKYNDFAFYLNNRVMEYSEQI